MLHRLLLNWLLHGLLLLLLLLSVPLLAVPFNRRTVLGRALTCLLHLLVVGRGLALMLTLYLLMWHAWRWLCACQTLIALVRLLWFLSLLRGRVLLLVLRDGGSSRRPRCGIITKVGVGC